MQRSTSLRAKRRLRRRCRGSQRDRPRELLEAHGGDGLAVTEVTRDMGAAYSPGVASSMPSSAQTMDRFHVM